VSTPTPAARAVIATAIAARETADAARDAVRQLAGGDTAATAQERLTTLRRPRAAALHLLDLGVVVERLRYGTSWEDIGRGLGLTAEMAADRYAETVAMWTDTDPDQQLLGDLTMLTVEQLADTAAGLDAWYDRHAEPWDEAHEAWTLSRALARP
jgi:hypothetical protein